MFCDYCTIKEAAEVFFLCKNVRRGLLKEGCRQGVCADCTRLMRDLGEFLLKLPIDKRGRVWYNGGRSQVKTARIFKYNITLPFLSMVILYKFLKNFSKIQHIAQLDFFLKKCYNTRENRKDYLLRKEINTWRKNRLGEKCSTNFSP